MNPYAKAPPRRRPKRVAKKIARRCGALHHEGAVFAWLDRFDRVSGDFVRLMRDSVVEPLRMFGQALHDITEHVREHGSFPPPKHVQVTFVEQGSEQAQVIQDLLRASSADERERAAAMYSSALPIREDVTVMHAHGVLSPDDQTVSDQPLPREVVP